MRQRLQSRLRLTLLQAHSPLSSNTISYCKPSSLHIFEQPSSDTQARISTSAARLAIASSKSDKSRLNWSQTAYRSRVSTPTTPSPTVKVTTGAAGLDQVRSAHMGHSHSHGHHHDNTFLTSKNKDDPGVRITKIGLYVNVGMAISKGIGGYAFNSQACVEPMLC